ncbi:MAG: hypothetical protein WC632_07095 [Candidatus Margulisiibacteriota bacterium]
MLLPLIERNKKNGPTCTLGRLIRTSRDVLGQTRYLQNTGFFDRAQRLTQALRDKAARAGCLSDFRTGRFYAAAELAITAHIHAAGEKKGLPMLRKGELGELYVYHMLRIIERLTKDDVPYLGWQAYAAAWLHDTVEDTNLTLDQIEELFGARVRGIVASLTNLKTSKYETKLQQAGRYEPLFIKSTMQYAEASYLKLADLYDYFATCRGMKPESIFYHYRFIDELVYPLATTVVGAREMALDVANKALAIALPDEYTHFSAALANRAGRTDLAAIRELIAGALQPAVPGTTVNISLRTPYEMLLKWRMERDRQKREVDQSIRQANTLYEFDQLSAIRDSARFTYDDFPLKARDLAFFDVIVGSAKDCYAARAVLTAALSGRFPLLTARSRDFIRYTKPSAYQALHDEFGNNDLSFRTRIAGSKMAEVNRLGIAPHVFTPTGLTAFTSPLLGTDVLEQVQLADRAGRRRIMQRLPGVRRVSVTVTGPDKRSNPRIFNPWVYQHGSWFDLAATIKPGFALTLSEAKLDEQSYAGTELAAESNWFTGQSVALTLARNFAGHDLYALLQEPDNLDRIRRYVAARPEKQQVDIGRRMIKRALAAAAQKGQPVPDFLIFDISLQPLERAEKEDAVFELIEKRVRWSTPEQFYRLVALGQMKITDMIYYFISAAGYFL